MTLHPPSSRDLRLASGLVLFTYIGLHLANHALGLVSVKAAEQALDLAVRIWHSLPGTLLLYGAATAHVALALLGLYRRRTLRMPPLEVLRIALGLGIPILVIGHVVATRIAWEAYRLSPEYSRVVWALWLSDGEGRQLALLVPGWLHGCLGVNFAFGRRDWYQRTRPVLFAVALLLPVLGALGFLAMGKELALDTGSREFLDGGVQVPEATRLALARLRDGALAAWFAIIGLVFAAREVRAWSERRRNAVVTIGYPLRNARVPQGWSVLEASRSHHIPHMSMCGGQARCSTCRVEVIAGDDHCPPPSPLEAATLDRIRAPRGVRLACQLRPTGDIAVVPLLAPGEAMAGAAGHDPVQEGDFVVVRVAWTDRDALAQGHLLAHDVVYLSQVFAVTVEAALRTSGQVCVGVGRDDVTAVYGLGATRREAARQALAGIVHADRALDALAQRHATQFRGAVRFRLVAQAGAGAIAETSATAHGGMLTAGEVFSAMAAFEAVARQSSGRIVMGDALFAWAGRPPAGDAVLCAGAPAHVLQDARALDPSRP